NREIWVGENRLYLGEDNIIRITILGELDEETQIEINNAGYKLMNTVEGKVNALVDLNKAGKISPGARKREVEISEHDKTGKVALFGLHPVARVVASFFMGISKKKDMRFFKIEEEALAWLKQ
ncbi:unnamed protein product, partial [marine sediment metagenome]